MLRRIECKLKNCCSGIVDACYHTNAKSSFAAPKYTNADKMENQMSDCPYSPAFVRSFDCIEQCGNRKQTSTWICPTFKAYVIPQWVRDYSPTHCTNNSFHRMLA